jgi:hypothetical protein
MKCQSDCDTYGDRKMRVLMVGFLLTMMGSLSIAEAPSGWVVTWSSKRGVDPEKTTGGVATFLDEYFFSSKETCQQHLLNHFVVEGNGHWIATNHSQRSEKLVMIEPIEMWMSISPSYHCSSLSPNK